MILTHNNLILIWIVGLTISIVCIFWTQNYQNSPTKFRLFLSIVCFLWPFTVIAYLIYRFYGKKEKSETCKSKAHTIKPCKDRIFYGVECLENETQLGFFKNEADRRPSSCVWIDKDVAAKLFKLFKHGKYEQETTKS